MLSEQTGKLPQNFVAGQVSPRVVNPLKVVQIEKQERNVPVKSRFKNARQLFPEVAPVRQAR